MKRPRDPRRWLPGDPRRPTRVYVAWRAMHQRCLDPRSTRHHLYGGRGIEICQRWRKFELFYEDMGDPPAGHSLERIDSNGNYEPANCRWADPVTQANNKNSNHWIEFNGKKQTMMQWSRELGIPYSTLRNRLRKGWHPDKALTTPVRKGRYRAKKILVVLHGEERPLSEWCEILGIGQDRARKRLQRGLPPEVALTPPAHGTRRAAA